MRTNIERRSNSSGAITDLLSTTQKKVQAVHIK